MTNNEWTEASVTAMVMNPDNINVVGRASWVKANKRLIDERGAEWWLNAFAAGWDESVPDEDERN